MTVLEGESLLNDATALLIYRGAVFAAAGSWAGVKAVPTALGTVLGSVVVGIVLGAMVPRLLRHITDLPTAVISQFTSTFAVWGHRAGVAAELSVSGPHPALTYGVVLRTLVLQGLCLRPLMKRLNLADSGEIEVETQLARQWTAEVALEGLAQLQGPIEILRAEHQILLRQSEGWAAASDDLLLAARRHVLSVNVMR